MDPTDFQQRLLGWFDQHGRKDLPWQQDRSPYRVWLSETMLQQTQVATVIPYFNAFIGRFPTLESLANAAIDDVLHLWSGLGYYARARNLHKAAQLINKQGYFPDTLAELIDLPGIGPSTAGAVLSIAFNKSHPILDGNVKRVLTRFQAIPGWPGNSRINKQLWALSAELMPAARAADYTQAIMDLGATLCTRRNPSCTVCPVNTHCKARVSGTVALYPTPKPAKTLPTKHLFFLLLTDQYGRVLLEKRPPNGIWGGLWSLPEFDNLDDAGHWCQAKNVRILSQNLLKPRRHTFSHYHLDYTPLYAEIKNPINIVMDAGPAVWYNTVWHHAEEINNLGLAAPIKILLQSLNNGNDND
ncbi:MAG: A/G-specific adenine glycosylase [Methylovulum sp.]|nr:A/G-specific adenine glycosylase [Methylovulum sp.]